MSKYRTRLPQLDGKLFLTDGGLETTLIFHDGIDLPHFAAFDLLKDEKGRDRLRDYYRHHASIATNSGSGFILESPTWRANLDWGGRMDYSEDALAAANRESIALMKEVRDACETPAAPMVISGCIGPRDDAYDPADLMSAEDAEAYHAFQIRAFGDTEADLVTAMTITNVHEAIGITRAAQASNIPVVISFTVETDGRLPTGEGLGEAIEAVDEATGTGPAYYMINCAHPTHFDETLASDEPWVGRLRGIRANASMRSHEELDNAPDLDEGDPVELGNQFRDLRRRHNHINVVGGCCGTDHRHIEQISVACRAAA